MSIYRPVQKTGVYVKMLSLHKHEAIYALQYYTRVYS